MKGVGVLASVFIFCVITNHSHAQTPFPDQYDLKSLESANGGDGSLGTVYYYDEDVSSLGPHIAATGLGRSISGAGDNNGDGVRDIVSGMGGMLFYIYGDHDRQEAEVNVTGLLTAPEGQLQGLGRRSYIDVGAPDLYYSFTDLGYHVDAGVDINQDGSAEVAFGDYNEMNYAKTDTSCLELGIRPGATDTMPICTSYMSYVEYGFRVYSLLAKNYFDMERSAGVIFNYSRSWMYTFDTQSATPEFTIKQAFNGRIETTGDLNGDGREDLVFLLSAYLGADNLRLAVLFGGLDEDIPLIDAAMIESNAVPGITLSFGDPTNDSLSAATGRGDFNGDGFDDLWILPADDIPKAVLLFGQAEFADSQLEFQSDLSPPQSVTTMQVSSLTDPPVIGYNFYGIEHSDGIAYAGDLNNDGADEVVISDTDAEEAILLYGRYDEDRPAVINLADIQNGTDTESGFVLRGYGFLTVPKRAAGDLNGDGLDDLILGDPTAANSAGDPGSGKVYVVYGIDSDGMDDDWEVQNFGSVAAIERGDEDGDGYTNLEEFTAGTDPNNELFTPVDADGDLLNDLAEYAFFGNLEQSGEGDFDGDGVSNLDEMTAGTNPAVNESPEKSSASNLSGTGSTGWITLVLVMVLGFGRRPLIIRSVNCAVR